MVFVSLLSPSWIWYPLVMPLTAMAKLVLSAFWTTLQKSWTTVFHAYGSKFDTPAVQTSWWQYLGFFLHGSKLLHFWRYVYFIMTTKAAKKHGLENCHLTALAVESCDGRFCWLEYCLFRQRWSARCKNCKMTTHWRHRHLKFDKPMSNTCSMMVPGWKGANKIILISRTFLVPLRLFTCIRFYAHWDRPSQRRSTPSQQET